MSCISKQLDKMQNENVRILSPTKSKLKYLWHGKIKQKLNFFRMEFTCTQCRILPEILPLFKLCERSELVNISQLFYSFSQTRLPTVELSQVKPKFDWKISKMTCQFCREKRNKNDNIFSKIQHCVVVKLFRFSTT